MAFERARRMWNGLVVVGVPAAVAILVWVFAFNGRPIDGGLAGCYLVILLSGRAYVAEQARRERPARIARVRSQLDRVISTLDVDARETESVETPGGLG